MNQARNESLKVAARGALFMSVLGFLVSMPLDSIIDMPGYYVLLRGWAGAFELNEPCVAFGWYANPLLLTTWLALGSSATADHRATILLASVATILGICVVFGSRVVATLAGMTEVMTLGPGSWVWVGSLCLGLASAILAQIAEPSQQQPDVISAPTDKPRKRM